MKNKKKIPKKIELIDIAENSVVNVAPATIGYVLQVAKTVNRLIDYLETEEK